MSRIKNIIYNFLHKRISPLVFIGVIAAMVAYSVITKPNFDARLRKSHVVVCGTIFNTPSSGKSVNVQFEFYYKGKKYSENMPCPENVFRNYKKGQNHLYVILEKDNPDLLEILDKPSDFEYYNVTEKDTSNLMCAFNIW